MGNTFYVSIPVAQAARMVDDAIVNGSITGERIDYYAPPVPGGTLVVLVYEKHFWRAGNRLTLTVTMDDLSGRTRVHCMGGGGGEGFLRFDWGASSSFARAAEEALAPYRLP